MSWVGGALSLVGSAIGGGAAKDAASTQAAATTAGIDENRRQFNLIRSDQAPYRAAGSSAIQKLQQLLGLGGGTPTFQDNGATGDGSRLIRVPNTLGDGASDMWQDTVTGKNYPTSAAGQLQAQGDIATSTAASPDTGSLNKKFSISDFWSDPVVQAGYQSGLDLGTKALKNAAPLTTGLDSGAALKELTKFGTDYTGQQAAGSQQRYIGDQNNQFNRLMGLVAPGQVANQTTAGAGTTMATNNANLLSSQGNAAGAAKIAGANAWTGGLTSISNWWNQNQLLNSLKGAGGAGWGGAGTTPVSTFNPQWNIG